MNKSTINRKNLKGWGSILLVLFLFSACEKEEVNMPVATFNMSAITATVDETIEFEYTGTDARQVVVYTGDTDHNYELKNQSNTGFVMNKGYLTYAYKTPGTYTVTVVATNYDNAGEEIIFGTSQQTIVIEDNRTDLRQMSLRRDLYNKELPAQQIGDILFFAVPQKVRINSRDIAVNASSQRLEIAPYSESASVLLNGEAYVSGTRYNLTQPLALTVISDAGDSRIFNVKAVLLPEFDSFSINGVQGIATYSDYDFDKINISVTLPAGTELTALVPVFVSDDAKAVKIGDAEQISGTSAVDFSSPVTYTLSNWDTEDQSLTANMEINVTVTTE